MDDGLSTDEIMQLALNLVGATAVPGDSAIYVSGTGLKRIMIGVDVGAAELLLARQLGVDGVIAHHPAGGSAVLDFPKVLVRGVELMVEAGVPEEIARQTMQPAIARAMLRAQAANHDHAPSVARLLGLPFLNVHLPLDEYGRRVMDNTIANYLGELGREGLVGDVVAALRTIPEIRNAPTRVMVPVGRLDGPAGRIMVFHGAGTNGGFSVAQTLFTYGVGTVVYIHLAPEEAEKLRALPAPSGNLVVSGHIASDLIGVTRLVQALEERGVELVRMSGVV
ncbi:MAG: hypothetical protein QOF73_4814 [Thermomicrobiales bacterium]|nr:hypothetical protein [Thermomicrobiales bacterium]